MSLVRPSFLIHPSSFCLCPVESPGIGTDRIVTATPILRTSARAATCCSLHHWAIARGAMRRLERSLVRSRCMNVPCGSSPDPAQQFAQHNPAKTAKDDQQPGLPHQSVYELVQLQVGHIHICCEFRASAGEETRLRWKTRRPPGKTTRPPTCPPEHQRA